MGDGRDGYQTDVAGRRGDARGHQDGVGAAGGPARVDVLATPRLRHQGVIDGEEVEQTAFGGGGQCRPVPAADHRRQVRPAARPAGASRSRPARPRRAGVRSSECLLERDGIDLALGGQRFGQPDVPGRQVQRLGLGLPVTGGQVDAPVARAAIADSRAASSARARPRLRWPLSVQIRLSSAVATRTTSNRRNPPPVTGAVEQPDQQSRRRAARTPRPGRCAASGHRVGRAAVAFGVLRRQLGEQRLGQRIILADGHEAEWGHCRHGHHLTVQRAAAERIPPPHICSS